MASPLIAFRTDAAVRIGSGHLRRCRSLAAALQRLGARSQFVMRRTDIDPGRAGGDFPLTWLPAAAETVRRGVRCAAPVHADWLGAEPLDDAEEFCDSLLEPVGAVVVDHYAIDAEWHERVAQRLCCPVVAIDDLGDRTLAVDLIIDHNAARDHTVKYRSANQRGCPVLGGPRYALLDPRFADAPRNPAAHPVRSIGVFMGGVDYAGWTLKAWHCLREAVRFVGVIEIAITSAHPQLAALRALARADAATRLVVDASDLVDFFGRHDLHLGAGGGATWERCCLGAPTLALVAAPNQREVLLPLAGAGVLEVIDEASAEAGNLANRVLELMDQLEHRRSMSRQAMTLVDGQGATRAAARILDLCKL